MWCLSRGKYWAGLRASCERVFHSGQLASYAPLMNAAAEKLAARLAASASDASAPACAASAPAAAAADTAARAGDAAGKEAETAAAGPDAAAENHSSGPAAVNISAALGTMTLEVIGTSAFGCVHSVAQTKAKSTQFAPVMMRSCMAWINDSQHRPPSTSLLQARPSVC